MIKFLLAHFLYVSLPRYCGFKKKNYAYKKEQGRDKIAKRKIKKPFSRKAKNREAIQSKYFE